MSNNTENIGKVVGAELAAVTTAMLAVVAELRRQPGFDDASFCAGIKKRSEHPATPELTKIILERLLDA